MLLSRSLHQSSGAFVSSRQTCGADGRTAAVSTAWTATASTPCLSGATADVGFVQGRVGCAAACCHSTCARGASHASASTSATVSVPFSSRGSSGSTSGSRRGMRMLMAAAADKASAPAAAGAMPPSPRPTKYSPLHANIEEFSQRVTLSEEEQRARNEVIETVRQCAARAFPESRVKVELFGSFATGMSAWHSDVDLVITGLMEPERSTGQYEVKDRGRVTARLRTLADQLRKAKKMDITRCSIISRARMPIIKLYTRRNVAVDISISSNTGVLAARYMSNQAVAYPPLRPLALVLKAYLRNQRLLDVATGGLSSYSLCNLIIAHLQEELKSGRDVFDLGETLYSFFLRYGEEFDYEVHAVSVRSGGIVPKRLLPFAMDSARFAASTQGYYHNAVSWHERLCVDCPVTGRDVSNGTYRIDIVRQAFYRAARQLEALARGRSISDTSINYLSALFDVNRVLKRTHVDEDPFFKVIGGPARDDGDKDAAGRGPRFEVPSWESFDEGEDFELDEVEDPLGDELEGEVSRSPKGRATKSR